MKGMLLVAGYATRLYPLTKDKPKALLEINKKPILDYILDEMLTIQEIDEIFVVSNEKFYNDFLNWAKSKDLRVKLTVVNDNTTNEDNRLGAIGDIEYTIKKHSINDDMIIIAGDNFFTYNLSDYYRFYKEKSADCVCVKEIDDEVFLQRVGVCLLDSENKVVDFEEKPAKPKSKCAVFATYIYKKDTMPLFKQYLEEGNKPDAPGNFVPWLLNKKDVFAYKFTEECYDIGTPEAYDEVCELFDGK